MRAVASAPVRVAAGGSLSAGRSLVVAASGAFVVAFMVGLALWVAHAGELPEVPYYACVVERRPRGPLAGVGGAHGGPVYAVLRTRFRYARY